MQDDPDSIAVAYALSRFTGFADVRHHTDFAGWTVVFEIATTLVGFDDAMAVEAAVRDLNVTITRWTDGPRRYGRLRALPGFRPEEIAAAIHSAATQRLEELRDY